ncbi:DUF6668 family protein [Agromyces cavernae]|uniref:DUF6668 family protein n=1 Tax=Agromyces cavernae TaxID=2898659 RepID=UPI003556BE95
MTDPMNPWVSRPAFTPAPETQNPSPDVPTLSGPIAPQHGIPVPDRVDQLPTLQHPMSSELWWVGTHGGAGETSLAGLVPGWAAASHGWPQVPSSTLRSRVVLVCRSNVSGLRSAQAAAQQWAAGMVPFADVLGLVVVADAPGRLPKPLRELVQLVGGGVPRLWTVPWIESWRLGGSFSLPDAPRDVRQLVDDLRANLR